MREVNFGDVVRVLPSQPLAGSRGAFNAGTFYVCVSAAVETRYIPIFMAVPLSNWGAVDNLTTVTYALGNRAYIKVDRAAHIFRRRAVKKEGELSEEEKERLRAALKNLFDLNE